MNAVEPQTSGVLLEDPTTLTTIARCPAGCSSPGFPRRAFSSMPNRSPRGSQRCRLANRHGGETLMALSDDFAGLTRADDQDRVLILHTFDYGGEPVRHRAGIPHA